MNKSIIETFIKKYSVGKNISTVKWQVSPTKVKVLAVNDMSNVISDIELNTPTDFTEELFIGIHDTPKLKKLVSIMNDNIHISVNKNGDKITSLSITDGRFDVQYCTADLDVIRSPKQAKTLPSFGLEIDMNKSFADAFVKASNALSDAENFAVLVNTKGKLEMVIGYEKNANSSKVTLCPKTLNGKDSVPSPLIFSSAHLNEILSINSDMEDSVLKIYEKGLAMIQFKNDIFSATYYLMAPQATN